MRRQNRRVEMITSHPDFMKRQYSMHDKTRGERALEVGIIIISVAMLGLWALGFAWQMYAPARATPPFWYN